MEYDFVYWDDPDKFNDSCREFIELGWQPQGGICIHNRTQAMGADQTIFGQAFILIKEEEEEEDA